MKVALKHKKKSNKSKEDKNMASETSELQSEI